MDTNALKAIASYSSEKHVRRIILGLQLASYLIEYDVDDLSYYLSQLLKTSEPAWTSTAMENTTYGIFRCFW